MYFTHSVFTNVVLPHDSRFSSTYYQR